MKKFYIKLLLIVILFFACLGSVAKLNIQIEAINTPTKESTPTASATSTLIDKLKKIEILKEKIATKVAELREKERAGVVGKVKSFDKSTITVTSKKGDQTIVYSEDTTFYILSDSGKNETSLNKIKAGEVISILGYFDTSKSTLSAKYIYLTPQSIHLIGKIANVERSNYTITVKEAQGNTTVDIETYTKIFNYNKEKGVIKSGFSKLKPGDELHLWGILSGPEANRISATRIYLLSLANNPTLSISPSNVETTVTSTPSP